MRGAFSHPEGPPPALAPLLPERSSGGRAVRPGGKAPKDLDPSATSSPQDDAKRQIASRRYAALAMTMEAMKNIREHLKQKFPTAVLGTHDFRGDETAVIRKESLLDVVRFLKEDRELDFNILMDLSAVDYLTFGEPRPRFEVVYHLYSLNQNHRVRIKVPVEEKEATVPSLTGLWPAADWYEREVWDMFGIRFEGHPHLKRILMYEEFSGHPLRKDYPVNQRQPLIGPKN